MLDGFVYWVVSVERPVVELLSGLVEDVVPSVLSGSPVVECSVAVDERVDPVSVLSPELVDTVSVLSPELVNTVSVLCPEPADTVSVLSAETDDRVLLELASKSTKQSGTISMKILNIRISYIYQYENSSESQYGPTSKFYLYKIPFSTNHAQLVRSCMAVR